MQENPQKEKHKEAIHEEEEKHTQEETVGGCCNWRPCTNSKPFFPFASR